MSDIRFWLLLQSIDGIGPVTYKNLLDRFQDPKLVFETDLKELATIPKLGQKIIERIIHAKQKINDIDLILEQLRNKNINVITITEQRYPEKLHKLTNPPPIIYLWKELPKHKTVGIIGTRDASQFSKEKATEFATGLSKAGYSIISGYAKGVDTAAHFGAVTNQGKTVAILPTGILKFTIHEELSEISEEFLNRSTILSEFFPLSEWSVGNALSRNRLTATLSDFILVIESGDSEGTVNTAEHAKELDKLVYVYNGIKSPMDEKIKQLGAIRVDNVSDLLAKVNS